jgi:hypothetical protein
MFADVRNIETNWNAINDMAKQKPPSRPTVSPTAARRMRIMVAVNKGELLGFTQAAMTCGLSLSAWMRSVCVESGRSILNENGKEVPFDKREG